MAADPNASGTSLGDWIKLLLSVWQGFVITAAGGMFVVVKWFAGRKDDRSKDNRSDRDKRFEVETQERVQLSQDLTGQLTGQRVEIRDLKAEVETWRRRAFECEGAALMARNLVNAAEAREGRPTTVWPQWSWDKMAAAE